MFGGSILQDIVNGNANSVECRLSLFGDGVDPLRNYRYAGRNVGTVLHFAALQGQGEVLDKILERSDFHVNMQDDFGATPLIACFKYQGRSRYDSNVMMFSRLFWDHKADPNIADKHGNTAVHWAAIAYHKMSAALHDMVQNDRVDIWKKNNDGLTPLDLFLRDAKIAFSKSQIVTSIIYREECRIKKEREKFHVLVDLGLLLDSVAKEYCEPCVGQEILAPSSVTAFMRQMARRRDFDRMDPDRLWGNDQYSILTKVYPRIQKELQDLINKYGNPSDFVFEMP
jgi:hypothetical protein